MMVKKLKTAVVVSIVFLLSACSSSDDNDSPAAPYIGLWDTGCTLSGFVQSPDIYTTRSMRFDSAEWVFTQSAFLDAGCTVQMSGTEETGTRTTFTTTVTASYTDDGSTTTTADGLEAFNLASVVTGSTTTSDSQPEEGDSPDGAMFDLLVNVTDTNVLFVDGALLGLNETPGSLLLTLPFNRQ